MPTSAATASATAAVSPVSRIGSKPRRRSPATAAALVGRTRSARANHPATAPSARTSTQVAAAPSAAAPERIPASEPPTAPAGNADEGEPPTAPAGNADGGEPPTAPAGNADGGEPPTAPDTPVGKADVGGPAGA